MKKITITLIAFLLLIGVSANAQSLNKEAETLKGYSIEAKVYLLKRVYTEIVSSAEEKWAADYEMQIHHINEESKAFLKVMTAFSDITDEKLTRILIDSMIKWGCTLDDRMDKGIDPEGADWRMIIYTYENQKNAYLRLKGGK
jgi:hypothetical protein